MKERGSNVLLPSQPIGTGFSTLTNRSTAATSLAAGARDLHAFLSIFTTRVFPHTAGKPWHFAGESFGGRWTTAYAAHVLQQQQQLPQQQEGSLLRIDSIIAVAASIDMAWSSIGLYDFFCAGRSAPSPPLMNATACATMAAEMPACEEDGQKCRETRDGAVCERADARCQETVGRWFWEGVVPGGWDPYDSEISLFPLFSFLLYPLFFSAPCSSEVAFVNRFTYSILLAKAGINVKSRLCART